MNYLTKLKLKAVHIYCDHHDKSTNYMIQFMQDTCNVTDDCVMNYLQLPNKEHIKLAKDLDDFTELMLNLE